MSLTFPAARAVEATGGALAAGGYAVAMILLAAGTACAAIMFSGRLDQAWPLLAGFILVAAGGSVLRWWTRSPRVAVAAAAALVLTGVWAAASAITVLVPVSTLSSSSYFFSNLTVSVVFLGTLVWRSGGAVVAVTVAAAATQTIALLAVVSSGGRPRVDLPALVVWAVVTLVLLGLELRRRRSRSTAVDFARAETRTRDAAAARTASLGRVALLHDTVLSDLAALAALPPGHLPARARTRFLETLRVLRDGREPCPLVEAGSAHASPIDELLTQRPSGSIPVFHSGDASAIAGLDPSATEALLLALSQCLANVDQHSAATRAELFVGSTGTAMTATLSDDGVGFDPAEVEPDKLGLRTSVHARLEAVGGGAEVWSSPNGGGTTVLMTVPLLDAARRESATERSSR